MSQENVELVRRQYELMDRGDLAAAMERIAPDFELDLSSLYPDAPILRGLDELLRWFYSGPWGGSARFGGGTLLHNQPSSFTGSWTADRSTARRRAVPRASSAGATTRSERTQG